MNNYLDTLLKKKLKIGLILVAFICLTIIQCKQSPKNESRDLQKNFINPPDVAKPRVWWHWMNGNITKEGIKKDLEWMKRAGIGGFQNFEVAGLTPQVLKNRVIYMSPEWKKYFGYATKLADSLGLEMTIASSPGWIGSGGPWVKPEQAMKKLVWSETKIEGGKPYSGKLAEPPHTSGPFQNIPLEIDTAVLGIKHDPKPEFYADVAVIAMRIPGDKYNVLLAPQPKITSSGGNFNLKMLTDGDVAKTLLLPPKELGQYAWIQYQFQKPETIQSLTIAGGIKTTTLNASNYDDVILEAGNDGIHFEKITDIPGNKIGHVTLTFHPVTAKFFRFAFKSKAPAQDLLSLLGINKAAEIQKAVGIEIAELVLHQAARINRFEEKAAFTIASGPSRASSLPASMGDIISKKDILNITSKMQSDGSINWDPEPGNWIIFRFGYSLTGQYNAPAPPEATGLEVDKLNPKHIKDYFTNYLDMYKNTTGGLIGKKGLQYLLTDSWEAGAQNWTEIILDEFKARRGYDMLLWLPVLTGYMVGSAEESERFLWDFRRTLADLVAENYYDQLSTILKEHGMGRYSESHEGGRAFIGDGMEAKRKADIPMSAAWMPFYSTNVSSHYTADIKESSSVANIYGKKIVAAESFTTVINAFGWSPETIKPVADFELANGVNQFMVHTSVHQPVDDKIPGISLGPVGQWFTRHETWAEQAKAWTDYLARSSYMMQQGNRVTDVLYFYGEDNNITSLFADKLPDIPDGYDYDFVNADALVNILDVKDGKIITPGGGNYQILVLDANCRQMSLSVLKKLKEMVAAGVVVIGNKPEETPSLSDDPKVFKNIVDELWTVQKNEKIIGTGKVVSDLTVREVLENMEVVPDFTYSNPTDKKFLYVHRKVGAIDIYWVSNRENKIKDIKAYFRVGGKQAEIWYPETGRMEQASYNIENKVTSVPLHLEPNDAVFIVFRNEASENSRTVPKPVEQELTMLNGPWIVEFQENRGAPAKVIFDTLAPWNENTIPGIKYFSGTGTYSKSFDASSEWFKEDAEIWLDLGQVKNLAEVIVNGKSQGIVWKTPFKVNITNALNQGENKIEVRVTNLWVNRLVGDAQPNVKEKLTYASLPFYKADSPLLPSGLIGPVKIILTSRKGRQSH